MTRSTGTASAAELQLACCHRCLESVGRRATNFLGFPRARQACQAELSLQNQLYEAQAKLQARVGLRSEESAARHNSKPLQRQDIGQRDVTWTTAQPIMQWHPLAVSYVFERESTGETITPGRWQDCRCSCPSGGGAAGTQIL